MCMFSTQWTQFELSLNKQQQKKTQQQQKTYKDTIFNVGFKLVCKHNNNLAPSYKMKMKLKTSTENRESMKKITIKNKLKIDVNKIQCVRKTFFFLQK